MRTVLTLTQPLKQSQIQSINDIEEYEFNEGDHNIAFVGHCQRLSCFSHTLQLVMAEFDNNERLQSLKKVIKKAQALVSKCNKSVKVTEKLIELSGKRSFLSPFWHVRTEFKGSFANEEFGEDMSTISMVIPIIMELDMHLDEMKNRPGLSVACTVLKDALHKRFDKVLKPGVSDVVNSPDTFEKVYVATTFLDQRYRDLLGSKAATTFLYALASS